MAKTKKVDGKEYISWDRISLGRGVYYEAGPVAAQLARLERNIHRCFHHRVLFNKLIALTGTSTTSDQKKQPPQGNRQHCRMNITGSQVDYFFMDGAVFITGLVLKDDDYQENLKAMEAPGAYRITNEGGKWMPEKPETKINTLHASVNGEVEDIHEVMQFMPAMIKHAYGNEIEIRGKGKHDGFTHLYIPGKNSQHYSGHDTASTVATSGSKTRAAARQSLVERTAACIEIAARAKDQIKWTVQGSGSEIFCDAVELVLKNNPELTLENQSVHFFNPHTSPMHIKRIFTGTGGEQAYESAFRSRKNIIAMAKGHRRYIKQKIAEEKRKYPGKSQMANTMDARKLDLMIYNGLEVGVKIAAFSVIVTAAVSNSDAVIDAVQSTTQGAASMFSAGIQSGDLLIAAGTIAGSVAVVTGVYKAVTNALYETATNIIPKYLALGHLSYAAIRGDRRLDQLTENDLFKGYSQLKNLKSGLAIECYKH